MMKKNKILFRADGNSSIGLGHLYRLFALVEMLKDDYEYLYITRYSSTIEIIPEEYPIFTIPEEIFLEDEPKWLAKQFNTAENIIIADGYQFVSDYQKSIKTLGFSLIYIDDLVNEHMYADAVINHSPLIKISDFNHELYTKFALGTDYALLRPSFLEAAKQRRQIEHINTVFICFGGADFHDLTLTCLKGILEIKNIKEIHVVLGGAYKHKRIFQIEKDNKSKVFIHQNLSEKHLLEIMNKCHLAVIPSSTISYEACCVKMLILGGYYIDNQINIYKGLQKKGIIYSGGDFTQYSIEDFEERIINIIEDSSDIHQKMLANQSVFFDGKSKERFISLVKELT